MVPSRLHHPTPNSHKDARERRYNTQTLLTPTRVRTDAKTHTDHTHVGTHAGIDAGAGVGAG